MSTLAGGFNPRSLRREMVARDLTVADLARMCQLDEGVIHRMLKPGNQPRLRSQIKVVAALVSVPEKPGLKEAFEAIAS